MLNFIDFYTFYTVQRHQRSIFLYVFRELSQVCFKKWSVIILLAFQRSELWNSWLSIRLSCYNNLQSSINWVKQKNSQLISHSSFKLSDRGKRVSKSSDREVLTSKQPMTVELTNQNGIRAPSLSAFNRSELLIFTFQIYICILWQIEASCLRLCSEKGTVPNFGGTSFRSVDNGAYEICVWKHFCHVTYLNWKPSLALIHTCNR